MSATKEYAIRVANAYEQADLDLYAALVSLQSLADLSWFGDVATWAPSKEWLQETQQQLGQIQHALKELEGARDSLDFVDG